MVKLAPLADDPMLVPPTAWLYQKMVLPAEVVLIVVLAGAQVELGPVIVAGVAGVLFVLTLALFEAKIFPFARIVQVIV